MPGMTCRLSFTSFVIVVGHHPLGVLISFKCLDTTTSHQPRRCVYVATLSSTTSMSWIGLVSWWMVLYWGRAASKHSRMARARRVRVVTSHIVTERTIIVPSAENFTNRRSRGVTAVESPIETGKITSVTNAGKYVEVLTNQETLSLPYVGSVTILGKCTRVKICISPVYFVMHMDTATATVSPTSPRSRECACQSVVEEDVNMLS